VNIKLSAAKDCCATIFKSDCPGNIIALQSHFLAFDFLFLQA